MPYFRQKKSILRHDPCHQRRSKRGWADSCQVSTFKCIQHNYLKCSADDLRSDNSVSASTQSLPEPWIVNKRCAWNNILFFCILQRKKIGLVFRSQGLGPKMTSLCENGFIFSQRPSLHLMVFLYALKSVKIHVYRNMSKLQHFSFILRHKWN